MKAHEVLNAIKNIDDRAYSMQYYNQKLRSPNDCRRIAIARENEKVKLLELYAKEAADET